MIEDKRDNEPNIYYYNKSDDPRGNEFPRCNTEIRVKSHLENKYARAYDNSLLEFDLNQNGILESDVDLGIHVNYRYRSKNTEAFTHLLTPKYELPYERELQGYASNITSSNVTSSVEWGVSDSLINNHMIYRYSIPIEEVLLKNQSQINFRVIILRTAKIWYGDRAYGTFIYPIQSCEYGQDNDFFTIKLEELKGNEFAKRIAEQKRLLEERRTQFITKNDVYTKEKLLKATSKLLAVDGLSIKLTNGKLINLEFYPAKLGAIMDYKKRDLNQFMGVFKGNLKPFLTEDEILDTRIFRIKQTEFAGYYIVAGAQLKDVVNNQSLHPMVPVVLESGKLRVVNEPPGPSYAYGESLTDQMVIGIQDRIPSLVVTPSDNHSYFTKPEFPLRAGFYMVWAGRSIWIFEIID